jgi:hypothetical protein
LPDSLDEPSGYFDESDYYKINGFSVKSSENKKNNVFPKGILKQF